MNPGTAGGQTQPGGRVITQMDLRNVVLLCILLAFTGHTSGVTVVSSTLGASVYLKPPVPLSQHYPILWRFRNIPLARRFFEGAPEYSPNYQWRCELFANGTLRLDSIMYGDRGEYELCAKRNGAWVNDSVTYKLNVYYSIEPVQVVLGKLSKSVNFTLPFVIPKYNHFQWYSEDKALSVPSSQKHLHCLDEYRQRCHVFANGTLKLDNISYADVAVYSVVIYDICGMPAIYLPYTFNIDTGLIGATPHGASPSAKLFRGISAITGVVGVIIFAAVVATVIKIKKEFRVYENPDFSLGPIYVNTIVGQQMMRSSSIQSQETHYENLSYPDRAIYNDLINPPIAQ